jgi:hypothetical protein
MSTDKEPTRVVVEQLAVYALVRQGRNALHSCVLDTHSAKEHDKEAYYAALTLLCQHYERQHGGRLIADFHILKAD